LQLYAKIVSIENEYLTDSKDFLTTNEAAKFIGLKPSKMRDLARKGIIPAQKEGKEWRFYRSDLEEWLNREENMD
jgi:excisionase family DNA binding protein